MPYFKARPTKSKSRQQRQPRQQRNSRPASQPGATHADHTTRTARTMLHFPNQRFGRLRLRITRFGWRGKAVAIVLAVFTAVVLLPAGIAASLHQSVPSQSRAWLKSADGRTTIRLYQVDSGQVTTLPLNEYLVGVLAAEMDSNAPMDALRTAAVAARTYAVHAVVTDSSANPTFAAAHGADVTDNGSLDLPWMSVERQAERFRDSQGVYTVRLQQAVLSTDGMIVTWQNQPILAFAFALSPGTTRDASRVFGSKLPYLPPTDCPDDAPIAKQPAVTLTAARLNSALELGQTDVSPAAFHVDARDKDGFVKIVSYQGRSWAGPDFATLLGLPSANFTLTVKNSRLVAECVGIGSDIGLSLHEAAAMAGAGKTWKDILLTFYPGTKIELDDRFVTADPL